MTDTASKPWYREFWPWFVITLLGTAIVACLITVAIAFHTSEPVISMITVMGKTPWAPS